MPEPDNPTIKPVPASPDYEKKMSDLNNGFDNLFNNFGTSINQQAHTPYSEAQTYSYNAKSVDNPNKNFEHYYSHSDFDKLGFNPWRDNESLYNDKASTSGDIWRATKAAGNLAWTGFKSAYRSYGDLFTGNALTPDYDSADEMRYWSTIGSSTKGGVSGFTSNLITNSGYTLGLIGSMALETAGLIGLEVLTDGAATPLAVSRLGKYGKDFGKVGAAISGLTETMDAFKNYGAAKGAWQAVKSTGKFVNPLQNTTELFGVAKNVDNFKDLTDLAKASKTGGAFFRDVQAANLTLAEAKLEGAATEKDLEEQLTREYKAQHNGVEPSLSDIQNIKEAAQDAGMKTLAWNIPTIYLTNKITFDPLLNPVENAVKGTAKYIGGEFIEKEGKGIVKATLKNTFTASLKPRNLLGNTVSYFKGNLSEGLQESLQEVISGTAKDYYKTLYDNASKQGLDYSQGEYQNLGVWDALAKNATDQFSGKGFETFASGFLMGGLVGVAGKAVTLPYQAIREYKREKSQYRDAQLNTLNEVYKDPLKYFGAGVINYSNGTEAVKGQTQAEQVGNQKEWLDFENQNLTNHVMTALETDTYNVFLEKLKRIKTMEPSAIKEAYNVDGSEVLSKIDKIIDRADKIKSNYDTWTERYQNPFDPRNFKKDSSEYKQEAIGYLSWEAAKKLAVFNDTTFVRNLDRIQGIHDDLLSIPGLKDVSGSDISLLLNPNDVANEVRLLNNEIEVLENAEVPSDKSTIKNKKAKLKSLEKFSDKLKEYYLGRHIQALTKEQKSSPEFEKTFGKEFKKSNLSQLKAAYSDYILHLAESKSQVIPVNDLAIENSFQKILDSHELKQENIYYSDAINLLADPKQFINQHKRLGKVFKDLYESREEDIKTGIENSQARIEDNTILKALFDRGFTLTPENAEKLLKDKIIPTEFYDINAKEVLDDRNPIKYQEFKDIVANYVEATKPETTIEESTPVTEEPTEIAPIAVEIPLPTKKLDIDIVKKFDAVKTEEDLNNLREEMATLMRTTTLDERNELGIHSTVLEDKLKVKEQELLKAVTMYQLAVGNLVSMIGESEPAIIVRKSKESITVRLAGEDTRVTIHEKNLKNTIRAKYSEQMEEEPTKANAEELVKTKENAIKNEKFIDNKEVLIEVRAEALKDPVAFEKQFMEELGCK